MTVPRLNEQLEKLYKKPFSLWKNYYSHVKYSTRDYRMYYRRLIIGLKNGICSLAFEKETNYLLEPIPDCVRTKLTLLTLPDCSFFAKNGCYCSYRLLYSLRGVQYEIEKAIPQDLKNLSQGLRFYIDKLLDFFRDPEQRDIKIENYRGLNRDKQIAVEQLRAVRARLRTFGQDLLSEAVFLSLHGGNK